MKWYFIAIKNYIGFSGRARRSEYWHFTLFNLIFSIGALLIDRMVGTSFDTEKWSFSLGIFGIAGIGRPTAGIFLITYTLAMFVPTIAVMVRRLHDVGKSGWMLLVGLIPVIGTIWLLDLFLKDSARGMNEYGANPKEQAAV